MPLPKPGPGHHAGLSYTRQIGDTGGMASGSEMLLTHERFIIVDRLNFGELPRLHGWPAGPGAAA